MTIKTDCSTLGSIRCAKAVRLGELGSARSAPPSLLAQDMTGFHNAMTTASWTKGTLLHNLFHRQRDHPNLYGIDRYPVTPSCLFGIAHDPENERQCRNRRCARIRKETSSQRPVSLRFVDRDELFELPSRLRQGAELL